MSWPTCWKSHYYALIFSCYYLVCWDWFNQLPARMLSWVPKGKRLETEWELSWGQANSNFELKVFWLSTISCADPLRAKIQSLVTTSCISLQIRHSRRTSAWPKSQWVHVMLPSTSWKSWMLNMTKQTFQALSRTIAFTWALCIAICYLHCSSNLKSSLMVHLVIGSYHLFPSNWRRIVGDGGKLLG